MNVLEDIRLFFKQNVHGDMWQALLIKRLEKTQTMLDRGYWIPPLDLPGTMALGLKQDHRTSRHLEMIGTCVYLGADLLDDLHDHELNIPGQTVSVSDVTLLSTMLVSIFPSLLVAEFDRNAETKLTMQATIARSLLKMAAGQQQDLLFEQQEVVSLKEVKQSVEAKSGEELALACLLVAQATGVSLRQQKQYEDFGRFLGTAVQFASDVHDLMVEPACTIKKSAHLLPLIFCRGRLEDQHLRQLLIDSGSLDYTALVIEEYCQKALEILESLELPRKMKDQLRERIRSVSLVPTESTPLHPPQGGIYENAVASH